MAFATADELLVFLGREDPWSDAELAQVEQLLDLVTAEIQAEIGQTIEDGTTTVSLAGSWSRDLELPERPITAVTSVSLNGSVLPTGSWDWNGLRTIRYGVTFEGTTGDWIDVDVIPYHGATWFDSGLRWGGPTSVISVTYTHGGTVPNDLKLITLRVAARSMASPSGDIRSEALGAYSVTYAAGTATDGPLLTGPERKGLRKRYSITGGTITAGVA